MSMHYFMAIVVKIRVLSEQKSSLKRQIPCTVPTEKHYFHSVYTGWSCSFLTSATIMGVQMGEMSKLG
jgi:hypothetical protein